MHIALCRWRSAYGHTYRSRKNRSYDSAMSCSKSPKAVSEDLEAPDLVGQTNLGFVPALFRHLPAVRREH